MRIHGSISLAMALALFGISAGVHSAQALSVSTLDCSGIDTSDNNVADWSEIDYLIDSSASVAGTTYYLDSVTDEWTTSEPADWRYSANLDKQANIQEMKMCNTDIMAMMLRTEEPMMNFYDQENDNYTSFYSGYGDERQSFTMPADYHYWMVWKMQAADGSGAITYLAANLEIDAGTVLDGSNQEDASTQVPKLYLYEESDANATFAEASFDANSDDRLVRIATTRENSGDCNEETNEGCEEPTTEKNDTAFEITQDISELFNYADFRYGDTINITAAMYNSDEFSVATASGVVDETAKKKYTFSKKAVTDLRAPASYQTATTIKLKWDAINNATSYQVRLIDPETDTVMARYKGIENTNYTLTDLTASTTYRVIVRSVRRKDNGDKTYSAWSSGYRWTTASE